MRTLFYFVLLLFCTSCASNLGPAGIGTGLTPSMIPDPDAVIAQASVEVSGFQGSTYNIDDQNLGGMVRLEMMRGLGFGGKDTPQRKVSLYNTTFLRLGGGNYQLRNDRYRDFAGNYGYFSWAGGGGLGAMTHLGAKWYLDVGGQVQLGTETGKWPRVGSSTEELLDGQVIAETPPSGIFVLVASDSPVYTVADYALHGRLIVPLGERAKLAMGYQHQWTGRALGRIRLGAINIGVTLNEWEVFGQHFTALNTPARRELQGGFSFGVRRRFDFDVQLSSILSR